MKRRRVLCAAACGTRVWAHERQVCASCAAEILRRAFEARKVEPPEDPDPARFAR